MVRGRRYNVRLWGADGALKLFPLHGWIPGPTYAADPLHRLANPVLYRLEEAKACWRAITAPVPWVAARGSHIMNEFHGRGDDYAARFACFGDVREAVLDDCGHMMHHDQPRQLAAIIEGFLAEC